MHTEGHDAGKPEGVAAHPSPKYDSENPGYETQDVNVSGIVAQRATRHVQGVDETLGTQLTGIAAVAYTFQSEAAVGGVASYAAEGNATINGSPDPDSHKRILTLSGVALYCIDVLPALKFETLTRLKTQPPLESDINLVEESGNGRVGIATRVGDE